MKYKVKAEESRFVVMDKNDNVLSIWAKEMVDEAGGFEKCLERFKKTDPKMEVEMVGSTPAAASAAAPSSADK